MRNVFKKSSLFLLCVAASAGARTKAPLILVPADDGPPPSAHVIRLHQHLLFAAQTNDLATVKKLLAAGADINVIEDYSKTHTPLTYAAESGNVTMTQFLLAHGADPNGKGVGLSPLFWTVSSGQTRCVRILLQHGADPYRACFDDLRPIDCAASDGAVDIVKLLIWRMPRLSRADAHRLLGQARNIALSKAVEKAPLSKIQAAVRAGANVNNLDADESPLMRAASRGSLPIMKFLLARGAQVNLRDSGGRTALMYAGDNDSAEPARLLLQHGAKISLRAHSGMTALMYAAQENWRVTALLIAHGAQVNARDQSGRTALHWAAALRDSKSLQVLLHHGASINAQDGQGETALMLASVQPDTPANARQRNARRDSLKLLIRAGASSHLKDKRGRTSSAYSKMHDMDFVSAG